MGLKSEYEVIPITKKEASELITSYHYLGNKRFRSGACYGLKEKLTNELVGCAIFHGVSAPETVVGAFGLNRNEQDGIWELGRLVLKPNYNGKNFGSFLVSNAVKKLKKENFVRALISYASSDRHVGFVYQASNWSYYGLSAPKNDFWIDGKIKERGSTKGLDGAWIARPRKHRYALIFDKTLHMKWKQETYPKITPRDIDCYGCDGKGIVKKRNGIEIECPICKGSNKVIILNSEVS